MIGVQTMFLRTGGCDYLCTQCDSLHAVLPEEVKAGRRMMNQEDIFNEILVTRGAAKTRWLTLSGGNPAMWELGSLVRMCQAHDIKVAIETQGSVWRDYIAALDQITISPKGPGMVGEQGAMKSLNDLTYFLRMLYDEGIRFDDAPLARTSIKIPVFDQRDLKFCSDVANLLLVEGSTLKERCFISLGNWAPPIPDSKDSDDRVVPILFQSSAEFRTALLGRYNQMSEEVMKDWPQLAHFKILPQMHVLQYGNIRGK